jgi:MFS family permease
MSKVPEARPTSLRHDPYAALRNADFRFYLIGWFIALIGTRMQSVAIAWEMYERTGEALSLGLVGLMQALPTMVLALPAGYLADRFNRPRLVMWSLGAMTLTSLGLAILSYLQSSIWLMYLLLFLDATAVILGRPARTALLPQLVPKEVFPNAVAWNTSLSQLSNVVGPAIGGFVIGGITLGSFVIEGNIPLAYVLTASSSLIYMAARRGTRHTRLSRAEFAGRTPLCPGHADYLSDDLAGYVWCFVGRRSLSLADLCGRDIAGRSDWICLAAGSTSIWSNVYGHPVDLSSTYETRRLEPARHSRRFWRGHHYLWALGILLAFAGDAFPHGRIRQRQHGHSPDAPTATHARSYARPGGGCLLSLYQRIQRAWRARIGLGGPLVRASLLRG